MKILRSTDNKYIGTELPVLSKGDVISLGDFEFVVEHVKALSNGNISAGNFNYQLECEE